MTVVSKANLIDMLYCFNTNIDKMIRTNNKITFNKYE